MPQPLKSQFPNAEDSNGVPKRPDIPKTSGNFFQLPMPPQLSHFNMPQPFALFDNKLDHKIQFLPSPTTSLLNNSQGPHFLPFGIPDTDQPIHRTPTFPPLPLYRSQIIPPPQMPQTLTRDTEIQLLKLTPPIKEENIPIPSPPKFQNRPYPCKFDSFISKNQNNNPFLYPQVCGVYEPSYTLKKLKVSTDFDEIKSIDLDFGVKEVDPYKFLEDNYHQNDSAIKIKTSEKWQTVNLGKIPESLSFTVRHQILNSSDKSLHEHFLSCIIKILGDSKIPTHGGKPLDFFRLKHLVEARGGLKKVQDQKLWNHIGKELGYEDDAVDFIQTQFDAVIPKIDGIELSILDIVNANNKREVLEEYGFTDKKMKLDLPDVPIVKSSAFEYRRSRRSLVLKGFPVMFDQLTIRKPGISDDENSIFEEWIMKQKEIIDCSIYDDVHHFTIDHFMEKDKLVKEFTGVALLDNIEDMEQFYWSYITDGTYLEVLSSIRMINYQPIFPQLAVQHSWNLNSLPRNGRSLLKYFPNEIEYLNHPRLSVGMTFSTENWTMEEHMLPLLDYNHFGLEKIWYFISPEDNFIFEKLLQQTGDKGLSTLLNHRSEHVDPFFARYCDTNSLSKMNTDYVLSPDFLKSKGIHIKKVCQRPGEFIMKYPGVYSYSVSLGLTVNESINFAPKAWLEFAVKGELYLANQGVISDFSLFEILVNISKNCKNPQLLSKASPIFEDLCETEIERREKVRLLLPELTEKTNKVYDYYLADDDLSISIPSVICLISKTGKQLSMSLRNFLLNYQKDKSKFDKNIDHFELLTFYEDEKLKQFAKSLAREITTSEEWSDKLELVLKEESKPSIKLLRQLYAEGEKIFTEEYLTTIYDEDSESEKYQRFKQLEKMLSEFEIWIEVAQKYLLSRHISRKRKSKKEVEDDTPEEIYDMTFGRLCEMIREIPNLSFYCEEMDQLISLTLEIEDYEVSARKFISTTTELDGAELHNILELGRSFGIELPSVSYLREYEKTDLWLKKYKEFEDTGLVKTFKDLDSMISFIELGKKSKAITCTHYSKISQMEELCNKTKEINNAGQIIVKKSQRSYDIDDITKVLHESFEFPVDPEIRNELMKIHSEYEEIAQKSKKFIESINEVSSSRNTPQFNEMLETLPKYHQVRTLLEKARSLKIAIPEVKELDDEYFKKTDDWLKAIKRVLHRQNSSSSVLKSYLLSLVSGVRTTIGNQLDEVLVGTEDGPSSNESIYCMCRRGESGLMVECEICSEWYHLGCFNLNKIKMKNKSFVCPICDDNHVHKELFEEMKVQFRPDSQEVISSFEPSNNLKFIPADEFQELDELYRLVLNFKSVLKINLEWKETQLVETNIQKVRFYLRKLIGCPIDFENETKILLARLKELRLIDSTKSVEEPTVIVTQDMKVEAPTEPLISLTDTVVTIDDEGTLQQILQQILQLAQIENFNSPEEQENRGVTQTEQNLTSSSSRQNGKVVSSNTGSDYPIMGGMNQDTSRAQETYSVDERSNDEVLKNFRIFEGVTKEIQQTADI